MLILLPGCATHYLWKDSQFSEPHAPAVQNHLQLYQVPQNEELLAVYDETARSGMSQRRAYFVFQNDALIAASRKPSFLPPSGLPVGTPVPTFESSERNTATNLPVFAVKSGSYGFEFYQRGFEARHYDLPRYKDRWNTSKQVLITPLAVALDSTIVAGVVAVGAAYLRAGGPLGSNDLAVSRSFRTVPGPR
jgi:hypothetical protein